MRNIKLTIEYDGTNYHGWQVQENACTVQGTIRKVLRELTGEPCDLIGSSRTDTGVHALGFAANFHTDSRIPPDKFAYALNALLPEDIVIKFSEEVAPDFHARFSSTGKKYRYIIHNSLHRSALLRNRAYHVHCPLDMEKMLEAAEFFVGEHDFSAFMSSGSEVKTTVRTIHEVSLQKREETITFEISGNGFLYNMVRIIAGTLIYVGEGKINPGEIPEIITSKDRRKAGKTAPAHGLYLVEVYY